MKQIQNTSYSYKLNKKELTTKKNNIFLKIQNTIKKLNFIEQTIDKIKDMNLIQKKNINIRNSKNIPSRLKSCTLVYIHSISEQKKRFLKGKCKKITSNIHGKVLHIVAKYFNMLLIMRYPTSSPKYI